MCSELLGFVFCIHCAIAQGKHEVAAFCSHSLKSLDDFHCYFSLLYVKAACLVAVIIRIKLIVNTVGKTLNIFRGADWQNVNPCYLALQKQWT